MIILLIGKGNDENMAELDIGKWINNVYVILKKQNMKITEFEKRTKIGLGYLSKVKTGKTKPGADKFISICNGCNIDINTLIEEDFSKKPDEIYVITNSLNELLKRVETDEWINVSVEQMTGEEIQLDDYDVFLHALFRETELETGHVIYSYNSIEYPEVICSTDKPAYSLPMALTKYITLICFLVNNKEYYELFIINNGRRDWIASSKEPVYSPKLKQLYKKISKKVDGSLVKQETIRDLKEFLDL